MKKRVFAIAAVAACAFAFSACDGENLDLLGNIQLTAVNPVNPWTGLTQAYADGETVNYSSSFCNVDVDSVLNGENIDVLAGTVMVGTTADMLTNDLANLTFPMCGLNLRDTVTGTYTISCPIDQFSFYEYLDTTDVNSLITSGIALGNEVGNLFAVAVSDTSFYIGYDGTITITSYATSNYKRVQGTVDSVNAVYITASQLAALVQMPEEQRATIDLATFLPHITFYGTFSSVRANIDVIIEALEEGEVH